MTGPVLRNHSSTVTRAKRPVTATWTALRIFWMAPRGNGRIGSIQPCARSTGAIKRKAADSTSRRFGDSMATGSCERRHERRLTWNGLHKRTSTHRAKGLRRGEARTHLGARPPSAVRSQRPRGRELVPRYTYRRLTKLPTTVEDLRRHTVLNLPGMLAGLRLQHTVMQAGGPGPHSLGGPGGLFFPLAGRGGGGLGGGGPAEGGGRPGATARPAG